MKGLKEKYAVMHVSVSTVKLIIAKPNVMQVFELLKAQEPAIIMTHYPLGNTADAEIADKERYVYITFQHSPTRIIRPLCPSI